MSAVGPPQLTHVHHDEVLTGEAVALDVQPAGLFMRLLGELIDLLMYVVILVGVTLFVFGQIGALVGDDAARMVIILTVVLVTVVLPTVIETASGGRSLGKLAIGARIVRADGGATGFRQAFIRALIGLLEIWFTLGVVAIVTAAFTPRAQRLGDIAAGTYAQRTRVPALPPQLPPVPPALAPWASVADVARLPDPLARRLGQFLRSLDTLEPTSRDRVAHDLLADCAPFVAPMPPAPPIESLFAIAAARRDREYTALMNRAGAVTALAPVLDRVPHGFPQR